MCPYQYSLISNARHLSMCIEIHVPHARAPKIRIKNLHQPLSVLLKAFLKLILKRKQSVCTATTLLNYSVVGKTFRFFLCAQCNGAGKDRV